MTFKEEILAGIPQDRLPEAKPYDPSVNHAPRRKDILTPAEKELALRNALRYFPENLHAQLAPEFAQELRDYGRIYMYRYRPSYKIYARPTEEYPCKCRQAAAMMAMIQNNLDERVAQHPHELIIYGGNGACFQNWAQYRLTMQYLANMVITNGMVIPNYSSQDNWERFNAMGVSQYGQMTAGSWMYIGPQGIVHGTTITVMNAARKQLWKRGLKGTEEERRGMLFVTAGLGGMSGAQPKAGNIAGVISITAEVNPLAAKKRFDQGWVDELHGDLDELMDALRKARDDNRVVSMAYVGNVVDLWERLADDGVSVDLGSDQTSLHNPFAGGYYPAGLTFDEAQAMMAEQPELFREKVHASLRRQVAAINRLTARGMYFFDYGNAFLLEAGRAGADIWKEENGERRFRYPSYVQDIMGPLFFDYGFGPFRWVCASGDPADLAVTDRLAAGVLEQMTVTAPAAVSASKSSSTNSSGVKSGQLVSVNQNSAYADCHSRKLLTRCSPPVRMSRSTSSGTLNLLLKLARAAGDSRR